MADTGRSEPLVNGNVDAMDDEEKAKIRPADIDADVREMERRKRVEMVMNSRLFREELERIIDTQMKDGNGPSGLLQQLSEMMGVGHGRPMQARSGSCVAPINDIRGVESMGYAKGEKIVRCKLAAVFRLMDLYGWTHGIGSQITARLNQEQELFLVNPFGVLFNEVTASSLVKLDMQAAVVEQGTTNFGVNASAFLVHSALYAARPDVKCVVHVVTPSVLSVSALKAGLLPLCQEAAVLGEASVHHYSGGALGPEGRDKMARDLGPVNKVLLLSNHGALCCGETVEEAFFHVYNLALACDTQMKLLPLGVENLVLMGDEARKAAFDAARRAPDAATPAPETTATTPRKEKQWRVGATHFEALMRMLDNAGFRTGYVYRSPLIRAEPPRPRNDIELPPAVASLGYLFDEDDKNGPWRKYVDGRKTHDRTRWLNSPNVYQKVEILETGTPDPRKITKWVESNAEEWVADGSPTHSSTPVKIDSALQFVPKNTHPREFKKLQQQIKDNRRADKITSGPQSHILEGVSWEEAKKLQDAGVTQAGEQVILVGAASKGIIQRGFQHNATVYKTPYAKNPFDAVTDDDLEEYKRSVQRHTKGESFEEEQSESEALSSSLRRGLASPNTASETEEESRDEPRVLRIETKLVPRASQAEVVLSDAADFPDSGFERSKSLRHSGQGASHEPTAKPSRAPPLPSRQPLHFHVARLSAAPRVLHASRLPQSSQGLTLNNPVDRRIKLSGVAKPSDSDVGLGYKNSGLKICNESSAIPVPQECTSPDNPFNGSSQLEDGVVTKELVKSQSKPNEIDAVHVSETALGPDNDIVVTDVSNKEVEEDLIYINSTSEPSLNSLAQRRGLSRSQHLKLLKLRFLDLYPTAQKSAKPPPVPPKPSRPVSLESEGYWSTSMVSLASMNMHDLSQLNRNFDTQLGLLEFSPLVGDVQAAPSLWNTARLERCQQGLAKELVQIDNTLEEIGAEGIALQEQLLDLLPNRRHSGDTSGEETMGEESVNYLDGEVSFLQFVGLDETRDTSPVEEGFPKKLCTQEDGDINESASNDCATDVLVDKTLVNTNDILVGSLELKKSDLLCKGDNAGSVEIAPKNGFDDYPRGDAVLESNTDCSLSVDQCPFYPKVDLVGEMDITVDYIDASLVSDAHIQDILDVDDVEPDHVEPVNVNDLTEKDNGKVEHDVGVLDARRNDEPALATVPLDDNNLVADTNEEELEGTDANDAPSVNFSDDSDGRDHEIISMSERESEDVTEIRVDGERNSRAEDALLVESISDSISFTDEEESDANNKDIKDDSNFPADIDATSSIKEDISDIVDLGDADGVSGSVGFKKAWEAHGCQEDVKNVLESPLRLDDCTISHTQNVIGLTCPMGHWQSSENGGGSGSEEEFDIAKHFPVPVRPLQYDDEEYIRKPFRQKRSYHVKVDEVEEEVDNEASSKLEEAIVKLAEAGTPVKDEYLSNPKGDGGDDGYLCEPIDDDGEGGCLIEGISFEEFFAGIEEDMAQFFAEDRILYEGEQSRSECNQVEIKGNIGKADGEEQLALETVEKLMSSMIHDLGDSNEIVCTAKDDVNIWENEEFVVQNNASAKGRVINVTYVKDNEDYEELFEHDGKVFEDDQPRVDVTDLQLADAELSVNKHVVNTKKEGSADNEEVVNMVKEELANILGSIGLEKRVCKVFARSVAKEEPNEGVEVIDLDESSCDGEEDHIGDENTNKLATSMAISNGNDESGGISPERDFSLNNDEEVCSLSDFEEVFLSDYMFDADQSNSVSDSGSPDFLEHLTAEQNLGSGSADDQHTSESGATPLLDSLDLEVLRLSESFIPIKERNVHCRMCPRYLARNCCLHVLTTSSDTGSTSESTGFTSPSDAEYDDDIPPPTALQLSQLCQSVLETPLQYSFHIRDENNESLELPPSPRPKTDGTSIVMTNRQSFVQDEQVVQGFEILQEAARESPAINEDTETGRKTQSKTTEVGKLLLNLETNAVATKDRLLTHGLEEVVKKVVKVDEAMINCAASYGEEESGFHMDLKTPELVQPPCVWCDTVEGSVKIESDCVLQQQNPDDTKVDEGVEAVDSVVETNSPAGTSGVLASSWFEPGRLWSLVSYTEYEPLGNSTTTSQLGAEGPPSTNTEPVPFSIKTEPDEDSTATSSYVSCGSGLSSNFVLSSPDSYRDLDEGNPQD